MEDTNLFANEDATFDKLSSITFKKWWWRYILQRYFIDMDYISIIITNDHWKNGNLKIDMSFWHVSYFFYLFMSKRNGAHALKQKLLTRMSLTIIRV